MNIAEKLKCKVQRILSNIKKEKNELLKLYKSTFIILAVSPTQISVHRLFSALKFNLSVHCSSMSTNIID